jgi:N-acetylglucosamine-6-phosphate deacetylase
MSGAVRQIFARRLFDGHRMHEHALIAVKDGRIDSIGKADSPPEAAVFLPDGLVAPGFVDLQVNGGGGVLFNAQPDLPGIRAIIAAHARTGTTSLLPTLITDKQDTMARAVAAAGEAKAARLPGLLGLHLEGPFLAPSRKGAHDAALMRVMDDEDVRFLAAAPIRPLLVTLAVEAASPERITQLARAGITVSIGHSDATLTAAIRAADAGARLVTHLFNAMSPLAHREPGLVGAALEDGRLHAGLIADGHHVDAATIRIALRAKQGPGRIFLVSDAMPSIGSDIVSFELNGRLIRRENGRLTLEDGTLAGVDCNLLGMVHFLVRDVGMEIEEALRMASLYPAEAIGAADDIGSLLPGRQADFVVLDDDLAALAVYRGAEAIG